MNIFRTIFAVFVNHRALLWQFALRNVELRHKGSHLGLVWSLLNPLVMLALYVMVFGYIFGGSFGVLKDESRIDYGLGIFLGLSLYNFFNELLAGSPGIVLENANFVKKVVFPLEVLPAANVLGALIQLVITLGLVFLGLFLFGRVPGWSCLQLPLVVFPLMMMGLGIAWGVSAVGVFLRDIRQIMPALATALMFSSAIFYSASKIPAPVWSFLRFNPMIHVINNARSVVLWGQPLDLGGMLYLYGCSVTMMIAGLWLFQKLRPAFADVM